MHILYRVDVTAGFMLIIIDGVDVAAGYHVDYYRWRFDVAAGYHVDY